MCLLLSGVSERRVREETEGRGDERNYYHEMLIMEIRFVLSSGLVVDDCDGGKITPGR